MLVEDAFRELRHIWFLHHLQSLPREREWETEEQVARREKSNQELKKKFDNQTERIIQGEPFMVAPWSDADMCR